MPAWLLKAGRGGRSWGEAGTPLHASQGPSHFPCLAVSLWLKAHNVLKRNISCSQYTSVLIKTLHLTAKAM